MTTQPISRTHRFPWVAAAVVILGTALSAAFFLNAHRFRVPIHESTAIIKVEPPGQLATAESLPSVLATQVQLVTSPVVLEQALADLHDQPLVPMVREKNAVDRLREAVSVAVIPNSLLMRVSARDPSPVAAELLARSVARAYRDFANEVSYGLHRSQSKRLEDHLAKLEAALRSKSEALVRMAATTDDPGVNSSGGQIDRERLARIQADHDAVVTERIKAEARVEAERERPVRGDEARGSHVARLEELETLLRAQVLAEQGLARRLDSASKVSASEETRRALLQDEIASLRAQATQARERIDTVQFEMRNSSQATLIQDATTPTRPIRDVTGELLLIGSPVVIVGLLWFLVARIRAGVA